MVGVERQKVENPSLAQAIIQARTLGDIYNVPEVAELLLSEGENPEKGAVEQLVLFLTKCHHQTLTDPSSLQRALKTFQGQLQELGPENATVQDVVKNFNGITAPQIASKLNDNPDQWLIELKPKEQN